jgi:hypothetical protein
MVGDMAAELDRTDHIRVPDRQHLHQSSDPGHVMEGASPHRQFFSSSCLGKASRALVLATIIALSHRNNSSSSRE